MNKFQKRCAKNKTQCVKERCAAAKFCGNCDKFCNVEQYGKTWKKRWSKNKTHKKRSKTHKRRSHKR